MSFSPVTLREKLTVPTTRRILSFSLARFVAVYNPDQISLKLLLFVRGLSSSVHPSQADLLRQADGFWQEEQVGDGGENVRRENGQVQTDGRTDG